MGKFPYFSMFLLIFLSLLKWGNSLATLSSEIFKRNVPLLSMTASNGLNRRDLVSEAISSLSTLIVSNAALNSEAFDLQTYAPPDGSFSFQYPSDFKFYKKLIKTHQFEVNAKSSSVKGFEIGVAVDPVRIDSLDQFGSVEEVGKKVVDVELSKDGCIDAKLKSFSSNRSNGLLSYTISYLVENTHYTSGFESKIFIANKKLYVCTGKCKQSDLDKLSNQMNLIVGSFEVR
mmetsp:Transcript_17072/g.25248  ORF Transcript_17072/g.25248 Transcript_17072/m.25248 type:complete len:231 (+) Transcript_17072:70-762(+)